MKRMKKKWRIKKHIPFTTKQDKNSWKNKSLPSPDNNNDRQKKEYTILTVRAKKGMIFKVLTKIAGYKNNGRYPKDNLFRYFNGGRFHAVVRENKCYTDVSLHQDVWSEKGDHKVKIHSDALRLEKNRLHQYFYNEGLGVL